MQVGQAQNLHRMISELKLSVLTSDLESLNDTVDARNAAYLEKEANATQDLRKLETTVESALHRLETHYYKSVYR